ncbi:MAG: MaoC family dehydratase [Actinomycetota bacterium]|nr:MaoC family dehydratase [Actinomycetota bacterium]
MEQVLERLQGLVGTETGVSDWMEISQERVNAFADATEDHQFIHVDEEMAKQTPFGGTIAHGFLTLSLSVALGADVPLDVGNFKMAINYGLDKVRFPAPVPVGSRIRQRVSLTGVEAVPGGIHVVQTMTTEIEGQEKPAMVAERLTRLYY